MGYPPQIDQRDSRQQQKVSEVCVLVLCKRGGGLLNVGAHCLIISWLSVENEVTCTVSSVMCVLVLITSASSKFKYVVWNAFRQRPSPKRNQPSSSIPSHFGRFLHRSSRYVVGAKTTTNKKKVCFFVLLSELNIMIWLFGSYRLQSPTWTSSPPEEGWLLPQQDAWFRLTDSCWFEQLAKIQIYQKKWNTAC